MSRTAGWIAGFTIALALWAPALGSSTRPAGGGTRLVGSGRNERTTQPGIVPRNGGRGIWPWVQTGLALALVVGMIFGLRYVLRRFGAAGTFARGSGPVEVLLRSSLSPRDRIYLVRLGERLLLVGSGATGLTTLCEVRDPEEVSRLLKETGATAKRDTTGGAEDTK